MTLPLFRKPKPVTKDRSKPDADRPYATPSELRRFDQGREQGSITVFRESPCEKCKRSIPKGKRWCSLACSGLDVSDVRTDDDDDLID